MRHVFTRSLLGLAAVLVAAPRAGAQGNLPQVEAGFRFVDVSGNEQMYRSQINDRPGFLIRALNWNSTAPVDGALDWFHLDATDVGAGPAGALRFQGGQADTFRLTFSWRRTNLYSALPAFANPFLDEGIVPGQQTFNRTRDIYDATVELFPGKKFTPILGYTRNVYRGPGTTTYHLGENEFALDQDVQSHDEEYRIGLAFDVGIVRGSVIQGWRRFRWIDTDTLRAGANSGNVTFPILGQTVTADGIARRTENKTDTPVTSLWIASEPVSRVKLIGSYVRADADADTTSAESSTGQFVSFAISRFFSGLEENVSAKAKTDYWRASVRAEVNLATNVDFTGGWTETTRNLDGHALVSSLFQDASTFTNVPVGDVLRAIENDAAIDRTDRVFDATVTARLFGPFSVNAGWSQLHQDVTFNEAASLLAAEPGGNFTRTVNTYGAGVTYARNGLTFGADYRRDDGDRPILRTDYVDRDRYKFRAAYAWKEFVRFGATWQEMHADNNVAEILYSTKLREVTGDLEVGPVAKIVTFHASGSEFKGDRKSLILQPQDFTIVPEYSKEIGHSWEAGLRFVYSWITLDGAYLWMGNDGSIPFTINRVRARLEAALTHDWGVAGEWLRDKYSERPAFDQAGSLANYNANRYGIFVHWRP